MSESKIDRIPSQRNDATKTAIAMIARDDSSKLIVRAFRWQDEWYDVRKIGNWNVSKLDMSKTTLFDTVKEAVAAAGISYLSSPPGKKLTTIYGERFTMFGKFAASNAKDSDLYKAPKYPADAVYEFVEDNSFHIYYYEDDPNHVKPAEDMLAAMVKVEAAAKSLEQAASAMKSEGQSSIVSPAPVHNSIIGPDRLVQRISDEYETKLRERINEKLIQAKKSEKQQDRFASGEIEVVLYESCIPDAYPTTTEQMQIFDRVMEDYTKAGWRMAWSVIEERAKTTLTQTISKRIRLNFVPRGLNPSST